MNIAFLFGLILLPICLCQPEIYKHMPFPVLEKYVKNLAEQYKDLVKLETAQEKYKLPYPKNCTPSSCPIYILTLTEFSTLTPDRPQVFLSGAVHGDEIVGPNVVVYLAHYLLKNYKKDSWLTYLLQNRVIVIMPAANAQGYYNEIREELHEKTFFDPNRDFPYNNEEESCMNTLTGRSILKVFKDHMFVLGITFHGGINSISYEWGSENHEVDGVAEESPDDTSMRQVGELLQIEAGEVKAHEIEKYELGRITDVVYSAQGGLEDWAYAASWANKIENQTHRTSCNSTTYGGFDDKELIFGEQAIRFPLYLVETHYKKHPEDKSFGNEIGIRNKNTADDGHIPRNIRLSLATIDMAKPYIRDIVVGKEDGLNAFVKWKIGGALHINETYVQWDYIEKDYVKSIDDINGEVDGYNYVSKIKKTFEHSGNKLKGVSTWIKPDEEFKYLIPLSEDNDKRLVIRIIAVTDLQWSIQTDPNPKVPPLTHFAKLRLVKSYIAAENGNLLYSDGTYSKDIVFVQSEDSGISVVLFVAVVTATSTMMIGLPLIVWVYFKQKYRNYEPMSAATNSQM